MRRLLIAAALLSLSAISVPTPPPEMLVLKIAIIPAESRVPGGTYVCDGAWKIVEVGKATYGDFQLEGYPKGVRVRLSASEKK